MSTISSISSIKIAKTDYPIHDLLSHRWSPRAFSAQPVEDEKLRSLLEAARWAASGGNMQPWVFVLARKMQDPELFARLVSFLNEGNVPWASQAPVLLVTIAKIMRDPGKPNRTAFYDLGLAVQNLSIQATVLGLYVHQMGGFSPEKARAGLNIPEEYDAATMIAIGYLGAPTTLSERDQKREQEPRMRKPLAEFVFGGDWGKTAAFVE